MFLNKEIELYSNLNKFHTEDKFYTGYCWLPAIDSEEIIKELNNLRNINLKAPAITKVDNHEVKRPTLLRQNEVTWVF